MTVTTRWAGPWASTQPWANPWVRGPAAITARRQRRGLAVAAAGVPGVGAAARERQPRLENTEGDFYVDHTCIGEPRSAACALQDCRLLRLQEMHQWPHGQLTAWLT